MKRLLALALVVGVLVGSSLPATGTAAEHFSWDNNWMDDHYEIDSDRQPPFSIGDPGSNFYYRAKDAAANWSGISGSALDFVYEGQRAMSQSLDRTDVEFDETWVMDFWTSSWNTDGDCSSGCVLGVNEVWAQSAEDSIDKSLIKINHDDDLDWEWTTGSPASWEMHLYSVMVHEFGHSVGGTDFPWGSWECDNWLTMCGVLANGWSYQATITSHEKNDVASKY